MKSRPAGKVALLGVDAAEISYIREHLHELPNFRHFLVRGRVIDLNSQVGVINACVWPCFFTESLTGDNGYYGPQAWDPGAMRLRPVTPDWLPLEPFWRDLARDEIDVIVADVPKCFAPRGGPGVEIAGWGTEEGMSPFTTNPPSLAAEIRRRFGRHPMATEIHVNKTLAQRLQCRRAMVEAAGLKAELTKWLVATHQWDLLIVVFGELHRGGHILWPSDDSIARDALREVYRAVDRALGEILACLPLDLTTVAILALHGMGHNYSQDHFTQKIVARINARFAARAGAAVSPRRFSLTHTLRELVPARLQTAIAPAVPRWVRDLVDCRSYTEGFDWRRTPAIAVKSDRNGYVRLNLRGREREGMLEPDSASLRQYISDLREGFHSFRAESGEPLVKEIHFAADIAPGKKTHLLPDLMVIWNEAPRPATRISSLALGEIMAPPKSGRTGHHRPQGFLAMLEPESRKAGSYPRQMSIHELASIIREKLSGEP